MSGTGTCPTCKGVYTLREDGSVRAHGHGCEGSYRLPVEAMSEDPTGGWGVTFHRHFGSNEIHRDDGPECRQIGTPRPVYVFDPDVLAEHDRYVAAEAVRELQESFQAVRRARSRRKPS